MAKVKAKDYENLDDASISRVIQALESDSPITKKAACEMLNISYNTTRLNSIIKGFKDQKEFEAKKRKALKGKPFSEPEIRYTILNYLKGDSIAELARSQYRTVDGIKNILKTYDIPQRDSTNNYWNPSVLPDEAVSESFEKDELVWSSRYNCVALIRSFFREEDNNGKIYSIWVFGKYNEMALQPACELGKLKVLKDLKVTKNDFNDFETKGLFYSIR